MPATWFSNLAGAVRWLLALMVGAAAGCASADALNLRRGVTEISRSIYALHMTVFWICAVTGAVVFGVMFYSMINHRASRVRTPATFHENPRLEVLMTVVPFAILVAMAVPASLALIDMYDAGGEDLSIEVHAHRWKWEYIYLDEDHNQTLRYFSNLATPAQQIANVSAKSENYLLEVDEPLVIPVNRKVRFRITSKDVIHAFWVPDFGIKQDAVPGIFNDLWTIVDATGVYRGQCAELCGKDHAFMPVVVRVVSQVEYEDWYERRLLQFLDRQALGNEVAPGDVTRALEVSKALVR